MICYMKGRESDQLKYTSRLYRYLLLESITYMLLSHPRTTNNGSYLLSSSFYIQINVKSFLKIFVNKKALWIRQREFA